MKVYAFITGQITLPDPFLCELSRRTKKTRRHLSYYEPNVVYCPSAVVPIVRCILDRSSILYKQYRAQAKVSLLRSIHLFLAESVTEDQARETILEDIITMEIQERLRSDFYFRRTRQATKFQDYLMTQWQLTRQKRLVGEQHLLSRSFSFEVERSLGELSFVMHKFGKNLVTY
jgi:hypothetical protein